jgi:hypothetical protein
VFAVHDKTVESFADLDKKLVQIKERYWQGKDLPFPVLLDATGKTETLYGIRAHPTGVLIDPDGKLVGEASAADLEAKLPPLPVAKLWARHRDAQKNVFWSFEPGRTTLTSLADNLTMWSKCLVALDPEAIRASGLTPEGPLPGVVIGSPITLRSLDELLLAPHGLGLAPSPDGKNLLITRRSATAETESYLQKQHGKELADRLDRGAATGQEGETKPLEIKDETLLDAVKRVGHEFDLPVALDAKAMHAKALDMTSKVSGTIDPGELRKSLTKMLDPLGLTVEVRKEVVFVTLKNK